MCDFKCESLLSITCIIDFAKFRSKNLTVAYRKEHHENGRGEANEEAYADERCSNN